MIETLIIAAIAFQLMLGIHFMMPIGLYLLRKTLPQRAISIFPQSAKFDYGVVITAYEQVDLVHKVVNSILSSDYNNFLVYIVADNCDITDLEFRDSRVILLKPEVILASNVKSHFYAIQNFRRDHDLITIIDSDNLVHRDYFNQLNEFFCQGFEAVQGVRKAKNLDSTYACLDEAGDIFYRLIDRKLLFEAGSSAALSGSGMAFTLSLYKESLEFNIINGAGFDKILQYEILMSGRRIAFAEKAIVYDEKTSRTDQLVNQRSRWINTWFRFFRVGLKLFGKSVRNANLNQFLFSIMLLRPPLFMLIMIGAAFIILDFFFFPYLIFFWITNIVSFGIIVFCALRYFKAEDKIYHSLRNVPKFIYFQILAMIRARRANKISVATRHFHDGQNIEDI